MSVSDVREVLRALAEVRDKEFYGLWVLLTRTWTEKLPRIEFRIYQVANSADARVVVYVEGTRPDGTEVNWGLVVMTAEDMLIIEGSIEVLVPDGEWSTVYSTSADTSDSGQAARLIHSIAAEVCSHREWLPSA